MNEIEQAIFDIIIKHMRINGSEDCSTSEFERDVEDAAKEIAAQQSVQRTDGTDCDCGNPSGRTYEAALCWDCDGIRR